MVRIMLCSITSILMANLVLSATINGNEEIAADTIRWTGAAGDNNWENPGNWDAGRVPGSNDDVMIPKGTPECRVVFASVNSVKNEGTLKNKEDDDLYIIAKGTFANYGTISGGTAYSVSIEPGLMSNSGTIEGEFVDLTADNIMNHPEAVIQAYGEYEKNAVKLYARHDVTNHGTITGKSGYEYGFGGNVDIHTMWGNVWNYGNISGGDGTGTIGNGGNVDIKAEKVFNAGNIRSGKAAPDGKKNGQVKIYARDVKDSGKIYGGESGMGKRTVNLTPIQVGDVGVFADSLEIGGEDSGFWAATLHLRGRTITVHDLPHEFSIEARDNIHFNTSADGVVDFSGTHQGNTIVSDGGSIYIFCNELVEPPEGLNTICDPDPVINGADTTIVDGYIFCFPSFNYAGVTDTSSFAITNFGTSSQILNYSISSTKAWVAPMSSSTPLMAPFDFFQSYIVYTIPEGTSAGVVDTILCTLTIGSTLTDTSYSTVTCTSEGQETGVYRKGEQMISQFHLAQNYPNPFNPETTIRFDVKEPCQVILKIYNLMGQEVMELINKKHQPGQYEITFNAKGFSSGLYFYKIQMKDFTAVKKIMLLE